MRSLSTYKNSDIDQDLKHLIRDQSIYQSDLNSNVSIISSADISFIAFYNKNAIKKYSWWLCVGKAEGLLAHHWWKRKSPNCDDSVKAFIASFG